MIETVASSTGEIVSLEEVKLQLGVWDSAFDSRVRTTLEAARSYCERWSESTLRLTTVRTTEFARWPATGCVLRWPPVVSIASIEYFDQDGNEQTLSTDLYKVHITGTGRAIIEWSRVAGATLPDVQDTDDAIKVTYTTGWQSEGNAPGDAKAAILLTARHLYGEDEPRDLRYAKEAAMNLLTTQANPSYA